MFRAKMMAALILCVCACFSLNAQDKTIEVLVDKDRVSLGESLTLTLKVTGVSSMKTPQIFGKDFSARLFSYQSQSQSGYRGSYTLWVFKYTLTPLKAGKITIPAIDLPGIGLRSDPLEIKVEAGKKPIIPSAPQQRNADKIPRENKNAKLQAILSKTKCYVGEPIELRVTLYLKKSLPSVELVLRDTLDRVEIEQGKLDLDGLDDKHFYTEDIEGKGDKTLIGLIRRDFMLIDRSTLLDSIKSGDLQMVESGQGVLNGRLWYTLGFRKLLIAKQAGSITLKARANYLKMVDPWLEQYRKVALSSGPTTVTICNPPMAGRPDSFAGHVGKYEIETSVSVHDVKTNDPFSLKIEVRGPYLKHFRLPPLQNQKELARWFNLPTAMEEGKIIGNVKVFQRKISAKNSEITEIPALELAYFDPADEKYHIARSHPISLSVRPSKVITAKDAEMAKKVETKELKAIREGMAYSYQSADVIETQSYGLSTLITSPKWAMAIFAPPVLYLLLLAFVTLRRRSDPKARKSKKAYSKLKREIKRLRSLKDDTNGELLEALKRYLGSKLGISPGAITYRDVEAILAQKEVAPETRKSLEKIFSHCEAGCYGGSASVFKDHSQVLETLLQTTRQIERSLK